MLVNEFVQICHEDTVFITYYEDGHFQIFRDSDELLAYMENNEIDYITSEAINGVGYMVIQVF